jgi:hypothetical protein
MEILKTTTLKDLDIFIGDAKTLLEKVYNKGSVYEFCTEVKKIKNKVEFESELYKLPLPIKITSQKIPISRYVRLTDCKNNYEFKIIVRITTEKKLYYLLGYYRTGASGYRYNNKFDRYKNLYMVYESLTKNKKYKYTAIRHAISHPEISNKKVLNVLCDLFNDDKINIEKYKHRKILQAVHEELLAETKKLLLINIWEKAKNSKEQIGYYTII